MKIAAFFDMDRTLIRSNSGTDWLRFLRERGEVTTRRTLEAIAWLVQYKLAILDMERLTAKITAELAGQIEAEMIEKCNLFNETRVFAQVAPEARRAVEAHRAQGHVVAILSSSTPYITEPLAARLGIEHVLCTRFHIAEGRFVGTHVPPACYGRGKVHWAERFAADAGVDLTQSYFYTDSFSDLPMLERVGERRVINPDPRLLRHARRRGWRIEQW